ncbi:hypothetical protein EVAR_87598_1 [Eumeta japonica]|uniref:Uncharacterized protein n=1 Tax=Eumeta variegata TaxID=151549 RepID=A0A4C1WMG1_EUMVA|nr:hypothetical protein EVAR_87598_1 [Eumeta japonica]
MVLPCCSQLGCITMENENELAGPVKYHIKYRCEITASAVSFVQLLKVPVGHSPFKFPFALRKKDGGNIIQVKIQLGLVFPWLTTLPFGSRRRC